MIKISQNFDCGRRLEYSIYWSATPLNVWGYDTFEYCIWDFLAIISDYQTDLWFLIRFLNWFCVVRNSGTHLIIQTIIPPLVRSSCVMIIFWGVRGRNLEEFHPSPQVVASPLCGFDLTSNFTFLIAFRAWLKLSQKLPKFGLSEQA